MNQHVTTVEHADPETGEITEVSPPTEPTANQVEAPAAEAVAVEAVAVPDPEKRKFPVQPVLKEMEPSLPTPPADRIDDNWGIARYATRGAMHLERYFVMSEKLLWPSVLIALLALVLIAAPMLSGLQFSGGGGAGGGGIGLVTAILPFWMLGCAITFVMFTTMDGGPPDSEYIACGGLLIGGVLFWLWLESGSDPNGTAAMVITVAKIVFGVSLILWLAHQIRKSISTGESRAILWMGGGYVFVVVVATLVLGSITTALSGFAPGGMQAVANFLTYDRDTYFDLGGGLRSGPEYRWMSEYAPKGGLSVAKHNALIASVRSDLANHSNDAASWTEITKLDPQPMITRAEKALRDNSKELTNGIVIIPEEGGPISIVAHVEGQWSLSLVAPYNCAVFLGPFEAKSECQNETTPAQPLNSYARQIIDSIKPTPAETKE
ncbi:hypothetical protein [Agrobacterium pusense]|uniref:hypothetical protein n=1 Tax=Agrobacterium pusense TaxID=648995 RepID=UPI000D381FF5|nr:hypothetical protein [Agrobacterium pusense]PTV70183.1 hypothetical protein DBL06_25300 [Agrobacterium pusense]